MLILYVYCDIVDYKKKQPDSLPSGGETYIDWQCPENYFY